MAIVGLLESVRVIGVEPKELPIEFVFYHAPGWGPNSFPGLSVLLRDQGNLDKDLYRRVAGQSDGYMKGELCPAWKDTYAVIESPEGDQVGWLIDDESFDSDWFSRAEDLLRQAAQKVREGLRAGGFLEVPR